MEHAQEIDMGAKTFFARMRVMRERRARCVGGPKAGQFRHVPFHAMLGIPHGIRIKDTKHNIELIGGYYFDRAASSFEWIDGARPFLERMTGTSVS